MTDQNEQPTDGGFADLGLAPELVRAVADLGYEEPTPIQVEAIPILVSGKDLLGLAATGTGKTAAFALPMLHRLATGEPATGGPRGIVLVPTRELAIQVAEAVTTYGRTMGIKVLPVYGGTPMHLQIRALNKGIDVVVGTPGRILDHLRRNSMTLEHVQIVVLDEADEMLDMGFQEDLESILAEAPETRQTALFSATFPRRLQAIAATHMPNPVRVQIEREQAEPGEAPRVRQVAYVIPRAYKRAALARVLDLEAGGTALIFCRTRNEVDEVADFLDSRGHRTEALHGGMNQAQRDRVMQRLRGGAVDLVVATDVAARGLDVDHLTHVVNFDVPSAPEQYVHRIGRTGRAGREGVALTLIEPKERRLLQNIERLTRQRIQIERVPTRDDVRASRLGRLRERVVELAKAGELDTWRDLVATMTEETELVDVAAAALKALQLATQSEVPEGDDEDLPDFSAQERPNKVPKAFMPNRGDDADHGTAPAAWTRVYVGIGRRDNVRPGDLFGAIVGETGLDRSVVGAIRVTERFCLVDIPDAEADNVINALGRLKWAGRRVVARRDRDTN